MKYDLNDNNYDILVAKFYHGKYWTTEDLEADLKRIKYIKRLIGKYIKRRQLNHRLILNHIIVLINVFGIEFATKLLFFKLGSEHYPAIKTFLLYLDQLPEYLMTVNGQTINTRLIPVDLYIAERLRE